ncbi:Uncharacterised protein [uncultured archaeon]|nr:Uncharacterised protein [uncultured archaeon]
MCFSGKPKTARSKTILVMSPNGQGQCPRLVLTKGGKTLLKDDYQGRVPARRSLLDRLCSL